MSSVDNSLDTSCVKMVNPDVIERDHGSEENDEKRRTRQ